MAQTNSPKLDGGDQFPPMTIALADGGALSFPDGLAAPYTLLLVYRGKW